MTLQTEGYNLDHRGIIRLYDGTVVYIIDVEYAADPDSDILSGQYYWEKTYTPYVHVAEDNPSITLDGHKWMRVKHAGDTKWQTPWRINAEDGKTPEIRVEGDYIQWGFTDVADSWTNIVALSDLKGAQGDMGPAGKGLEPDRYCYYGIFKDSNPVSTGCTSCNAYSETVSSQLYISLGDGIHVVVTADVTANRYWSEDGTTWIALGSNDIGKKIRYMADDVLGTNSIDYRTTNTEFNSRGKGYVFEPTSSQWVEAEGLVVANPLVAYDLADIENAKFLSDFQSTTIGFDVNKNLILNDETVDTAKLKDGTFTHGLTEGSTIKVNPEDLDGYGIKSFTSTALSEKQFQVATEDFISNGLNTEDLSTVDGEDHKKIVVNVDDLINSTSGLESTTETDTYKDLKVKAADAILVDADGVNVLSDELTLTSLDLQRIKVNETDNGTTGILAKHLNKDVANQLKGIRKGDGTATDVLGSLEVIVDASSIGFDSGTGALKILDNGVQGIHLNDNTCDTSKGIEVTINNNLAVRLKTGGGLEFDNGEIAVTATDILTNNVVKSLNTKVNDVTLTADNSAAIGSGITIAIDNSGAGISVDLTTDLNTMKSYLGIVDGTYAPIVHTHAISDVTGLQAALDTKVTLSTTYGDSHRITSANGLELKDQNGVWWKVGVNESGNLFTQKVV